MVCLGRRSSRYVAPRMEGAGMTLLLATGVGYWLGLHAIPGWLVLLVTLALLALHHVYEAMRG